MRFRVSLLHLILFSLFAGAFLPSLVNLVVIQQSNVVPEDISSRIRKDFGYFSRAIEAQELIEWIHFNRPINVGSSQFSRAALVIANGDIRKLKELAQSPQDPRDVILQAVRISDTGRSFNMPFSKQ